MGIYDLKHSKILHQLLPIRYRQTELFYYIKTMFDYLSDLYNNQFLLFRDKTIIETQITGQKIRLEWYLNHIYSVNNITIINNFDNIDFTYIYKDGESTDVINDEFIHNKSENILNGENVYLFNKNELIPEYDFTVNIPQQVINSGVKINQIKSVIDRYVFLGSKYEVVIF